MKHNTLKMAVMLAIAGVGLSTAASAQREISGQIEEVVVTAQHREQNLQDVPVAVTALDESAIEKIFARDLTDVTGKTPNLVLTPILGNGTAAISIRGMQLNDVEKSFDPAVAVYQDGVYLQTTTGALLNVWDAERIEVLRGPQGTLFGKNLTDESYWYHTLDVSAAYTATSETDPSPNYVPGLWTFGTINRPRYFGAEVQYRF